MKRPEIREVSYNNFPGEKMILFTFAGNDRAQARLLFNETQYKLIRSREIRSFYIRCKKERIMQEIDAAKNNSELEQLAKKYDFCDVSGFTGINLVGLKRIMKVITEVLYKYPKLRGRLCFIGTHVEFEKLLAKLEQGDNAILKRFNLQHICSIENVKELSGMLRNHMAEIIARNETYLAMALNAFGLFDAMLFDHNDYEGYAYLKFTTNLRANAESGFHPQECHMPEFVAYHELGHLLDYMCGLCKNDAFQAYYSRLTESEIRTGLSNYALTSSEEFIAEAFAEFMCNAHPRSISRKTVELLDQAYAGL